MRIDTITDEVFDGELVSSLWSNKYIKYIFHFWPFSFLICSSVVIDRATSLYKLVIHSQNHALDQVYIETPTPFHTPQSFEIVFNLKQSHCVQ